MMMAKCRNITNRINELENCVNNFSQPNLSFSEDPKRNMRCKMNDRMSMKIAEESTRDLPRCRSDGIKCNAERESDAFEENKAKDIDSPNLYRSSKSSADKSFCDCKRMNSLDGKLTDFSTMVMMDNTSKRLLGNSLDNAPSKLIPPLSDDEKTMDNYLIDSLRGEIEKVRHRLYAIGKRDISATISCLLDRNKTVTDCPAGDNDYQSELVKMMKDLQEKNDELSNQLNDYKKKLDCSMTSTEETANLMRAYEDKVKALHEQTLKSSKIIAHSKEKFCNILRSRNGQIKNLFDINQQLKKNIVANEDQMNKLNNNYDLLKAQYKELEKSDNRNREENERLRKSMATLEKELKIVYKECSMLKEDNIRFFKKLESTKEELIKKYVSKLDDQEGRCRELLLTTVESEAKLMKEVSLISENMHTQGNELENLRTDVKYETMELQYKYEKLVYEYEALVRKFREYEHFDEIKCSCIEQELKEFSMKMKEKEGIILGERDELRALVKELAKAIKRNKTTIRELNSTNEQQESVIEKLNEIIKVKDEKLQKCQEELKQVIIRCENSRHEIDSLKKALNDLKETGSPEHEKLEKKLQNSREILKQEKENNLIKQKIIQDKEETIVRLKNQLTEKSNELEGKVSSLRKMKNAVDHLSDDLKYRELDLEKERKEKIRIIKELECIKTCKKSLVTQISDLENAIKNRCRNDEIDRMDQKETVNKLQRQIRQQREEWDVQRKSLQRDKEKALHAAKFASQKLLDTVSDFQKQMYQQKTAQSKLAMLLQAKEQQLESLTLKVRSLLPSQKEADDNCSLNDCSLRQNICSNICQIKQLYPRPH